MTETTQHKSNTPIEWGQAEGFSKYLISTDGQVYSLKRDRLLPQGFTERGYKQVDVCNDEGIIAWCIWLMLVLFQRVCKSIIRTRTKQIIALTIWNL